MVGSTSNDEYADAFKSIVAIRCHLSASSEAYIARPARNRPPLSSCTRTLVGAGVGVGVGKCEMVGKGVGEVLGATLGDAVGRGVGR